MYNKKCNSTFLFIMALACLLTLIVPFMNVKFLGNPALILKILYYTFFHTAREIRHFFTKKRLQHSTKNNTCIFYRSALQ